MSVESLDHLPLFAAADRDPLRDLSFLAGDLHRRLAPRKPLPREIRVAFYPYAHLNNTIRLRDGVLAIRLSDMLEDAPFSVLRAVVGILLCKLLKQPVSPTDERIFVEYTQSAPVRQEITHVRRTRGFKFVSTPKGTHHDLDILFDELNATYFDGLLPRPTLTWSRGTARRILGHYDAAHDTIAVSRYLDSARIPRFFVAFVLYHEMLHVKHPVRHANGRRCVHSREFQADERRFLQYQEAMRWMELIAVPVVRRKRKRSTR